MGGAGIKPLPELHSESGLYRLEFVHQVYEVQQEPPSSPKAHHPVEPEEIAKEPPLPVQEDHRSIDMDGGEGIAQPVPTTLNLLAVLRTGVIFGVVIAFLLSNC